MSNNPNDFDIVLDEGTPIDIDIVATVGPGAPLGGNAGEVLRKKSGDDYDTEWAVPVTTRYVHTQSAAATNWSITHPLGGRPSVTIVDSAGTQVIGQVNYHSDVLVTVSFTAPFSGFAYLT